MSSGKSVFWAMDDPEYSNARRHVVQTLKFPQNALLPVTPFPNPICSLCLRMPALLLCLASLACLDSKAQSSRMDNTKTGNSGKGVQLVQRIDDVLYGVDPISLAIVDRRHVTGVLVRVDANRPSPALGYSHFLADCGIPMRFVVLATALSPLDLTPQGASARARVEVASAALASEKFARVGMLDGSRSVAEFACSTTQRPARAAQIAHELYERGGPLDMRSALCDLQPDGAFVTREDVEVRFSDSEKVVAVNNQWLSSGTVTDTEISFGRGGARWRVDRNTAEASLVNSAGKTLFAGSCVAAQPR